MVEPALRRHQITQGDPADSFLATPKAVPTDLIDVSAARFVKADGSTFEDIVAKAVGPFGPFVPSSGHVERWDLVTLDPATLVYNFSGASNKGTNQAAGSFKTSIPAIPANEIPVCAVRIDETGSVVIASSDIVDLRGFYHTLDFNVSGGAVLPLKLDPYNAGGSAGSSTDLSREDHVHPHGDLGLTAYSGNRHHKTEQVEHTQIILPDWTLSSPDTVKAHLDELAARLNTAAPVTEVDVASGTLGVSLDAAHADHEHFHGDLGGGVGNLHNTLQNKHIQVVEANWNLASPDSDSAHLEELASRALALEGRSLAGLVVLSAFSTVIDLTTISFTGLDPETDPEHVYLIIAHIKKSTGSIVLYDVFPNGITINQDSAGWEVATGGTILRTSATLRFIHNNGGDANKFAFGMGWLQGRRVEQSVSRQRHWMAQDSFESGGSVVGHSFYGTWDDTATDITSIDIVASIGSEIRTGSRITLCRVRMSP